MYRSVLLPMESRPLTCRILRRSLGCHLTPCFLSSQLSSTAIGSFPPRRCDRRNIGGELQRPVKNAAQLLCHGRRRRRACEIVRETVCLGSRRPAGLSKPRASLLHCWIFVTGRVDFKRRCRVVDCCLPLAVQRISQQCHRTNCYATPHFKIPGKIATSIARLLICA